MTRRTRSSSSSSSSSSSGAAPHNAARQQRGQKSKAGLPPVVGGPPTYNEANRTYTFPLSNGQGQPLVLTDVDKNLFAKCSDQLPAIVIVYQFGPMNALAAELAKTMPTEEVFLRQQKQGTGESHPFLTPWSVESGQALIEAITSHVIHVGGTRLAYQSSFVLPMTLQTLIKVISNISHLNSEPSLVAAFNALPLPRHFDPQVYYYRPPVARVYVIDNKRGYPKVAEIQTPGCGRGAKIFS